MIRRFRYLQSWGFQRMGGVRYLNRVSKEAVYMFDKGKSNTTEQSCRCLFCVCVHGVYFLFARRSACWWTSSQAVVWSAAERIRYLVGDPAAAGSAHAWRRPPNGDSNGQPNGHHIVAVLGGEGVSGFEGNAGGLKMSVVLGDALAEAFIRRPFVRFLDALRCITKELATFGRYGAVVVLPRFRLFLLGDGQEEILTFVAITTKAIVEWHPNWYIIYNIVLYNII